MAKKTRLILVGGGGFGRELAAWAEHTSEAGRLPAVVMGYIDDREGSMGTTEIKWMGTLTDFRVQSQDLFLLGVGNPATKAAVVGTLRERGGQFARLIHPAAILGRNNWHGEGVIMAPLSMNTADTRMGDFVTLLSFSGLGHDASAGAFCTISSHVDLMGGSTLGERVLVGSGARIMPGIKVGDDAIIGAGAMVMRRVAKHTTVFTPPAKRLTRSKA